MNEKSLMHEAVLEALEAIEHGDGGPFGCVIVKDGSIIGRGHNRVLSKHDPTCHGEMEAIRDACKHLGTHDLSGSILYTTSEPCPMCLGGILWANIQEVVSGCSVKDAENIGFRDTFFYDILTGKDTSHLTKRIVGREECLKVFAKYKDKTDVRY